MKSKLLFVGIITTLIYSLTSCDLNTIYGNEIPISKEFEIEEYSEIKFAGGGADFIYEYKDGPAYLRIELDSNLFECLDVQTKDNVLVIGTLDGVNISPSKYEIYTNSPKVLNKFSLSGGADLNLLGYLNSDNLEIIVSGSGSIKADSLYYNNLGISISGSGSANIKGAVSTCNIKISGSGEVDAKELITKNLNSKISGSGTIYAHVTDTLDAKIGGSGDVYYLGKPTKVNSSIGGSGNVAPFQE